MDVKRDVYRYAGAPADTYRRRHLCVRVCTHSRRSIGRERGWRERLIVCRRTVWRSLRRRNRVVLLAAAPLASFRFSWVRSLIPFSLWSPLHVWCERVCTCVYVMWMVRCRNAAPARFSCLFSPVGVAEQRRFIPRFIFFSRLFCFHVSGVCARASVFCAYALRACEEEFSRVVVFRAPWLRWADAHTEKRKRNIARQCNKSEPQSCTAPPPSY